MKILLYLKSGAGRSFNAWRGILITWVTVLFLISLLVLPVKSGFKGMLGSSMITEQLKDTVNIDVISDLQQEIGAILPVIGAGFLLVCFFGFLLNIFLTGGIFTLLSNKQSSKSSSLFFSGGASNFWSFLIINVIITAIIILSVIVISVIPIMILSQSNSGNPEPGIMGKTVRIALIILALLLPVLLLVADYARAWQADNSEKKPFKAIGFGFMRTFKTFFLSYPLMLTVILVQAGYGALVIYKLMPAKPSAAGDVFLFFMLSQLLFIIKILMRIWRYGCITSAFEDVIAVQKDYQDMTGEVVSPV